MTAQRSRKEELKYRKYQKESRADASKVKCLFCDINENHEQFLSQTKHFKIIKNIFGYSIWDNQLVAQHLMIVPKKHTTKLGNLPSDAANEFLAIIDKYEDLGFNFYARSPGSIIKSIPHQHTHLIKPAGKRRRLILFLVKPYFRISF